MRPRGRLWLPALGALVTLGLLAGLASTIQVGSLLASPMLREIGPPPEDLPAESVRFASASGSELHGWFVRGRDGVGAVALMHGIRADRRAMLDRARFLNARGYAVLLFDFQAHGQSDGEHITFGHLESHDASAAVAYLRYRLPDEPVAAIGTSLGAAAMVLGPAPLDSDAMIVEAMYSRVETAISNRLKLRFGAPGAWLTPLLSMQLEHRLGIATSDLSPATAIGRVRCPLLLIAGEDDRRTTIQESREIFSMAPGPKELWAVPGAAHVDFHRFATDAYESRVLDFLAKNLPGRAGQGQDTDKVRRTARAAAAD